MSLSSSSSSILLPLPHDALACKTELRRLHKLRSVKEEELSLIKAQEKRLREHMFYLDRSGRGDKRTSDAQEKKTEAMPDEEVHESTPKKRTRQRRWPLGACVACEMRAVGELGGPAHTYTGECQRQATVS